MSDSVEFRYPPEVRIVVVDGSRLGRDMLVAGLEQAMTGVRVETACDVVAAIELAARAPSVLLVDWALLGVRPLRSLERLARSARRGAVVLLSNELEDDMVGVLRQSGARGALTRDIGFADLTSGLARIAAGEEIFALPKAETAIRVLCARHGLTPRESQVMAHYVRGASHADIARRLSISESTVRVHVSRLHEKLGVHSRSETFAFLRARPAALRIA